MLHPKYMLIRLALFSAASLISMVPVFFFDAGGDVLFHLTLIRCFGEQFWQGDFYPQWCMEANAGLGAPLFLFYFPFPYFLTAMLTPLQQLGVSLEQIYTLGIFFCTLFTCFAAWAWLSEFTAPRVALFGALIYLLMPYRMEVMLFRSAYAELWVIAWMPMVLRAARLLVMDKVGGFCSLAFWMGLCFITHVPCALVIAFAVGIYVLILKAGVPRAILRAGIAVLLGALASAFFTFPAWKYMIYTGGSAIVHNPLAWPNNFVTMENLTELGQGRILINLGLTILAALALAVLLLVKRKSIKGTFERSEAFAAAVMCVVAVPLLFPFSKPAWDAIGFLSTVAFPWRMQLMLMAGVMLMFMIAVQSLMAGRKTSRMDGALLIGLMMMLSLFVVTERDAAFAPLFNDIAESRYVTQREYRSAWTPEEKVSREAILERHKDRANIPQVVTAKGIATTKIKEWGWKAIVLEVSAVGNATVRLDHTYFPVWHAATRDGTMLMMKPEKDSGRALLEVPPGEHWIRIRMSAEQPGEVVVRAAYILSLLVFFWVIFFGRRRHTLY